MRETFLCHRRLPDVIAFCSTPAFYLIFLENDHSALYNAVEENGIFFGDPLYAKP